MSNLTRPAFIETSIPHTKLEVNTDFIKARVYPNGLAEIILDRPKALNAQDFWMVKDVYRILRTLEADPNIKCLVIMSAIDKALSAGGDVVSLIQQTDYRLATIYFRVQYVLHLALAQSHISVISLMRGIVMGGGAGLSMSCRFRLVSETVSFAMPETQIGLFPDVGHTYILSRLPFGVGLYAGLTSARLTAGDVMHLGLGTHFIRESSIPDLLTVLRTENLALVGPKAPATIPTNFDSKEFNPLRVTPPNEEQQHLYIASILERFASPSPRQPFLSARPSNPLQNLEKTEDSQNIYTPTSSGMERPTSPPAIPPSPLLRRLPIIAATFVGNKSLSELISRLRSWAELAPLINIRGADDDASPEGTAVTMSERKTEAVKHSSLMTKLLPSMIQFAKETLATLKVKSILSMIVTFHLFKLGETAACLAECQAREYRVIVRIVQRAHLYSDLHEGVRTLLIEKGKRPPVWRDPRDIISEEANHAHGSMLGNHHAGVKPTPGLNGATVDLILGGAAGDTGKESDRLQAALEIEEAVVRRLVAPLPRKDPWDMDLYDYFADAAKGGKLMFSGEEFMHNMVVPSKGQQQTASSKKTDSKL